ncbi:MAG: hypothetical protein IIY73_01635, partial [Solobacterium sp.]|nr:hypothetical protein [Solobacterium sp.]
MKRITSMFMALAMSVSLLTGCAEKTEPEEPVDVTAVDINVGVLKGPTGMGAIKLMDDAENGVYPNYHFTL